MMPSDVAKRAAEKLHSHLNYMATMNVSVDSIATIIDNEMAKEREAVKDVQLWAIIEICHRLLDDIMISGGCDPNGTREVPPEVFVSPRMVFGAVSFDVIADIAEHLGRWRNSVDSETLDSGYILKGGTV